MASEEVFYDVAMRQLDNQMQRIGALDAKGTTVFAFSSSLLALFAILASLGPALPTEGIRHMHSLASYLPQPLFTDLSSSFSTEPTSRIQPLACDRTSTSYKSNANSTLRTRCKYGWR
jgi:hypothetical protein